MVAATSPQPRNPFVGINPFEERDGDLFYGRDQDIIRVSANFSASRLTVLYGPSGAGKTSLLQAGVLRSLHSDQQNKRKSPDGIGPPTFAVVVMDDWSDTLLLPRLRAAIHAALERAWPGTEQPPVTGETLSDMLRDAVGRVGSSRVPGQVLVMLDQFEQFLLTHRPLHWGERGFPAQLVEALNDTTINANFLICLREDWLAGLDVFQGRVRGLLDHRLRLDFLDRAHAREAILKPLETVNWEVDDAFRVKPGDGLLDAVLDDPALAADASPGHERRDTGRPSLPGRSVGIHTPFLQLVLTRLWRADIVEEKRYELRRETLEELGRAERIIQDHVRWIMNGLSPRQRWLAASLAPHLISPEGAKHASSAEALAASARIRNVKRVRAVLVKLAGRERGILRPVSAPPGLPNVTRYEVVHDSLGKEVRDWGLRYPWARRIQLMGYVVVAAVLVTAAIVLGEWRQAEHRRNDSLASALAAASHRETDDVRLLLAAQAYRFSERGTGGSRIRLQVEDALRAALHSPVAASRLPVSDTLLATGIVGGRLAVIGRQGLWVPESTGLKQPIGVRDLQGIPTAAAFSADGRVAAVGSENGMVCREALVTARHWCTTFHPNAVRAVVLDSSGAVGMSLGQDGQVRAWVLRDTNRTRTPLDTSARAVAIAIHPRGRVGAAATNDGRIVVFRLSDDPVLQPPQSVYRGERATALAFSDRMLVAGFRDGTMRVYGAPRWTEIATSTSQGSEIRSVVARADTMVAAIHDDGTVRLLRRRDRTLARTAEMAGVQHATTNAALLADSLVAVGWEDGVVRLWPMGTAMGATPRFGHVEPLTLALPVVGGTQMAFLRRRQGLWSPETLVVQRVVGSGMHAIELPVADDSILLASSGDGRIVAAGGHNGGEVLIVQIDEDGQPRPRDSRGLGDPGILAIALNATGSVLVAADHSGQIVRWDVASDVTDTLAQAGESLRELAVSADGRLVAWLDNVGRVRTAIQVRTGFVAMELDPALGVVTCLAFSPSGETLAACLADGTVALWSVRGGPGAVRLLLLRRPRLRSLVFSPRGDMLAVRDDLGKTHLWPLSDRASEASIIHVGHASASHWFTHNGRYLVNAGSDGTVSVWLVAPSRLAWLACQSVQGHDLSYDHWQQYVGGIESYERTCPGEHPIDRSFQRAVADLVIAGREGDARRLLDRARRVDSRVKPEIELRSARFTSRINRARMLAQAGLAARAIDELDEARQLDAAASSYASDIARAAYFRISVELIMPDSSRYASQLENFRLLWMRVDSLEADVDVLQKVCLYGQEYGYRGDPVVRGACSRFGAAAGASRGADAAARP